MDKGIRNKFANCQKGPKEDRDKQFDELQKSKGKAFCCVHLSTSDQTKENGINFSAVSGRKIWSQAVADIEGKPNIMDFTLIHDLE